MDKSFLSTRLVKVQFSCSIGNSPFATKGKKKGVNQLCCYASVSPNTCTNTTAKPTPEGASIRFPLLIGTFEVGDFRRTPSRSKHFLYPIVIVKRLHHICLFFVICISTHHFPASSSSIFLMKSFERLTCSAKSFSEIS